MSWIKKLIWYVPYINNRFLHINYDMAHSNNLHVQDSKEINAKWTLTSARVTHVTRARVSMELRTTRANVKSPTEAKIATFMSVSEISHCFVLPEEIFIGQLLIKLW